MRAGFVLIIDIHGHVIAPPEFYFWKTNLQSARGYGIPSQPGIPGERIDECAKTLVKALDSVGTDLQIISPRPFQLMHSEKPASVVRHWCAANNDIIAAQVKLYPNRIQGMAGLPQVAGESPAVWLDELERAVTELGLLGCLLNPDPYEGEGSAPPLGDEYWYPLYDKLVQLDVPALIHPAGCKNDRETYSGHFITEESIAALSLLDSNVFKDFPTLKIIVSHGGGSVPYQVGRWRAGRWRPHPPGDDFDTDLKRLYFDTVLYNKESIELLLKICGVDRCMFGTEKPGFGSARNPNTGEWLDDLRPVIEGIDWLTESDRDLIFETTARAVFNRMVLP